MKTVSGSVPCADRGYAGSSALDGAASGTPYRPNSCQVDKRLSFLVQRPVERRHQGTVSPQSAPGKDARMPETLERVDIEHRVGGIAAQRALKYAKVR